MRGWFDPGMGWEAAPRYKRGCHQTYSGEEDQETRQWRVSDLNGRSRGLFGMAVRQTTGFFHSLWRLDGLDWSVPDSSTLSRRQKTLAVNIPHRRPEQLHHPWHPCHKSLGINPLGERGARYVC